MMIFENVEFQDECQNGGLQLTEDTASINLKLKNGDFKLTLSEIFR